MIYITHNKNDFSLSAWLWTCPLIIAVSVEPLYVTDKPSTPRPKLLINPNNLFAISCAEGSAGVAGAACGSAGAVFSYQYLLQNQKTHYLVLILLFIVKSLN